MYNKLPDKDAIMANILCLLPVLFILVWNILGNNVFISSTPSKKVLLYSIIVYSCSLLCYYSLTPLHEIGHYLIALFFRYKRHLNVDIWMDRTHVSCCNWTLYKVYEARTFLVAGVFFKIAYCIMMICFFYGLNIKLGIIIFGYVIWNESFLNIFPIIKESDGYKFFNIDVFYNEKPEKKKEKEEYFVKRIYPLFLIGISVIIIPLFRDLEKVILFLYDVIKS